MFVIAPAAVERAVQWTFNLQLIEVRSFGVVLESLRGPDDGDSSPDVSGGSPTFRLSSRKSVARGEPKQRSAGIRNNYEENT